MDNHRPIVRANAFTFLLAEFKMSFDPSALLDNVHKKAKGLKSKTSTMASSKGKKRAREAARPTMVDLGQSSQNPTPPKQPTPQPQVRARTPCYGSDLLADDDDHMPTKSLEEYAECALIQGIVDKYEKEVDINEGVRTLELLTLKTLSVARGLGLKGLNSSDRIAELEVKSEVAFKKAKELEKALEAAKVDLKKAEDEVEFARGEAEEAKLELIHSRSSFEAELAKVQAETRAQAIDDFKKSDEFKTLLGQYGSGSYYYGLRLARSFLRTKLPEDLKPIVEELKTVNELAKDLELSSSEGDGNDEDDDAGTPDNEGGSDHINLD
ncbi:uncharacterized protein LOC111385948 isoform X1 [Olea europaea var. sylvestris]|uniref:uncharacterized protein LOC111385948 isoform X1 n=2 Tax=Olea europaea var. sylvestris TaxID=158386 RepID=UPI000C1D6A42|nr:uncharacterized protein LOC111385948 isoform X1 [Olea europaea var. sylvestris]